MMNLHKTIFKTLTAVALVAGLTSCEFDEQIDPNGPSLQGVQQNASIGQLNELAIGVTSSIRFGVGISTTASGSLGREFYIFDADPRNTADLLGKDGIGLDNNSFYSTAPWNGNYRAVKNANLLIEAAMNTEAVSGAQLAGYLGFAKTMKAHELIEIVKLYGTRNSVTPGVTAGQASIRVDVADPDNLGPLLTETEALQAIRDLLDEANSDLSGASFAFEIPGFSDLDSPSTFAQFNRALHALVSVYLMDGTTALTSLSNSYLDVDGDLNDGPKHLYSQGGNDQINPVFKAPSLNETTFNNGDQIIVHPSFIDDAEPGDQRVEEKTAMRPVPTSQDDLNGQFETRLYSSLTSPIDILRNEELILIFAEASIQASNFNDARIALNVIRNSAGLDDYMGPLTEEALTDELLMQRRYSLWSENHRMYDLRRYNRTLEELQPEVDEFGRPGDQVFNVLPIPLADSQI